MNKGSGSLRALKKMILWDHLLLKDVGSKGLPLGIVHFACRLCISLKTEEYYEVVSLLVQLPQDTTMNCCCARALSTITKKHDNAMAMNVFLERTTTSPLPILLVLLALQCGSFARLFLAAEAHAPAKVTWRIEQIRCSFFISLHPTPRVQGAITVALTASPNQQLAFW